MNFMQFCNQKGTFSTLNLWFAYFVQSKMSIKGIIMLSRMNITRFKRKILIILDFENGLLPIYLPLWYQTIVVQSSITSSFCHRIFFKKGGTLSIKNSTIVEQLGKNIIDANFLFKINLFSFYINL